jgi:hypothetical protein
MNIETVKSYIRLFIGACISQLIVEGTGILSLDLDGVKRIASAGVAALLVVTYNWVNPKDNRYGLGSAHGKKDKKVVYKNNPVEDQDPPHHLG